MRPHEFAVKNTIEEENKKPRMYLWKTLNVQEQWKMRHTRKLRMCSVAELVKKCLCDFQIRTLSSKLVSRDSPERMPACMHLFSSPERQKC